MHGCEELKVNMTHRCIDIDAQVVYMYGVCIDGTHQRCNLWHLRLQ